jgi:hypothetical protein
VIQTCRERHSTKKWIIQRYACTSMIALAMSLPVTNLNCQSAMNRKYNALIHMIE